MTYRIKAESGPARRKVCFVLIPGMEGQIGIPVSEARKLRFEKNKLSAGKWKSAPHLAITRLDESVIGSLQRQGRMRMGVIDIQAAEDE